MEQRAARERARALAILAQDRRRATGGIAPALRRVGHGMGALALRHHPAAQPPPRVTVPTTYRTRASNLLAGAAVIR